MYNKRPTNAKRPQRYALFVLIALIGLLALSLWPSAATAVPLTDDQALKQAWKYAGEIGVYRYQTDVIQTTHPTEKLVNVGRSSKTTRMTVAGLMDRPNDTMLLKIQGNQTNRAIEIKVDRGVSYGRFSPQDEWTEVENQTDMFAPGGDPLGYLNAAENVQEVGSMK